jgi:putative ABC transport system permease protein
MPNYVLDAVRSMDGVSYAVPLFIGGALAKLNNGIYQSVNVVGLDDESLFGRPLLEQGNIQDIYADNTFIVVHDAEFNKLENPKIGTSFELNDHRVRLWALPRSLPTDLMVCQRFIQPIIVPSNIFRRRVLPFPIYWCSQRMMLRWQASRPKSPSLGYIALTKEEFNKATADYYTTRLVLVLTS